MTTAEYRRMIAGAQSRVAGATFESTIETSLQWYEEREILKAKKTPEPMKPLGKPDAQGHFRACYTKAAQVDFSGTMIGGRSVRFEAKQTNSDRFERKRLTDEQMDDLRGNEKLGALCFVLLCFDLDRFYRVPWRIWDNMKAEYGRQYVTEADLQIYRIPYVAGVIKILDGIAGINTIPDICVACGTYAGEGRHICPSCERRAKGETT